VFAYSAILLFVPLSSVAHASLKDALHLPTHEPKWPSSSRAGVVEGNMGLEKGFFNSVSAGCLLSFACVTLISAMSSPWYQGNVPGLIRMLSALVIPYGLSMSFLIGAGH
jgi:hypothetical protein